MAVKKDDLLATLPPEWPDDPLPAIQAALRASGELVIVLDDDPTGTQTVHGVPVLTEWSVSALRRELAGDSPATYLLTNTRSMPIVQARAINAEIGRNLVAARGSRTRDFVVVSRSDSTLRGHFPGEVAALAEALGQQFDAWLLIPFFDAGGRLTIGDVHYVAEGDLLIPAGATPFARDAAFGYRSSDLRAWVSEKTRGQIPAEAVASIGLEDIRGGPERVAARLLGVPSGAICVVNAASRRDLDVFTLGLLAAERRGRRYLYRTAASFVAARAGIAPRPPLTRAELDLPRAGGGLIVVGSHVPRTSAQLSALLESERIAAVEIDVESLVDGARQGTEIDRVARAVDGFLARGEDVVAYTSRQLIGGDEGERSLEVGGRVSAGLVSIVRSLSTRPRYLLAKGGITSSDLATGGLGVRRAVVLGQVLPGIPAWRLGAESRHPGLVYIVFPGNVGGAEALIAIVEMLR